LKAQISCNGKIVIIAENPTEAFAIQFLIKDKPAAEVVQYDLTVIADSFFIGGLFTDEAERLEKIDAMRFCPICKAKIDHNNTAGFNEDRTVYFCPNCGNAIDVMAGNPYGDDN
jgi:predicted RNA-binding Zn-ribbon protein involved in translation (DUF1610 family)